MERHTDTQTDRRTEANEIEISILNSIAFNLHLNSSAWLDTTKLELWSTFAFTFEPGN